MRCLNPNVRACNTCVPLKVKPRVRLTYNLDVDVSTVQHVFDLNGQRVLPGVSSLRRADEEDGVHVTVACSNRFILQGDAIFEPGHDRARLTLQLE